MEPIMERLSAQDCDTLIAASKVLRIPEDWLIFEEGATAEHVYLLHEGKVSVYKQIGSPMNQCPFADTYRHDPGWPTAHLAKKLS